MAKKTAVKNSKTKGKKDRKSNKKESKKNSKKNVVEEVPVSDVEVEETVDETVEETSTATKSKKNAPTRDSVLEGFDSLIQEVTDEISKPKEERTLKTAVKFLRTVNKQLKTLRSQSGKVMKNKNKNTKRKGNNNSGFLKPVKISQEMAEFTGWDPEQLRSRVDVTREICSYIKEHDLQNPDDRRQIQVEKDPVLQKLLGYNKKSDDPLTYYSLQTHLKKHFQKVD